MRHWVFIVLLISFSLPPISATSFARDWKAGLMIGGAVSAVDDPAGSTELKVHPSYLNGIATIPYGRDRRIFTQIFYNEFDLDQSRNKVGAKTKSLGLNTSYQWKLRLSRQWKPWIGAGLGFSSDSFENRFLLDQDGFVMQRFLDREDEAINLILNASMTLKRMNFFDLGGHVQVDVPISGDITRFTIAGTILF